MASYNVLVKSAPVSLALVRDGFSAPAFVFGPIWFVWHRAWLGAGFWLSGITLIAGAALATRIPPGALILAIVVFAGLMAMEASELRKRSLTRRGYQTADVVEAHGASEAEIRFLARHASALGVEADSPARARPGAQKVETVGLFLSGT